MADERNKRGMEDALLRLVTALLPEIHDEDDEAFTERRNGTFEGAKNELLSSNQEPLRKELGPHIFDFIKGKLMRDSSSPEPVLRFQTLFSRLTTLPVLDRKWEVLYLLYLLSGSSESPSVSRNIHDGTFPPFRNDGEGNGVNVIGLHNLPNRKRGNPSGGIGSRVPSGGQQTPVDPDDKRKSGAQMLEESGARLEPSETHLLELMPHTLMGLSSKDLPFQPTGLTAPAQRTGTNSTADPGASTDNLSPFIPTTKLVIPTDLPLPVVSLLHTLAEPSLLYSSLRDFIDSVDDTRGGLVGQSLRAAIETELKGYLELIGTVEGEIRRAVSMLDMDEGRGIGKTGVTLKRCVIWTREATMGLRLLSLIVEQAKDKKGGQLISSIHSFVTSHGDPFVTSHAERILSRVTRPFYNLLRHWIYDGELSDPFLEFFVSEQSADEIANNNGAEGRKGASSVWEDKYKLDPTMVPSIITTQFAKKVFLIGKSLNFIRYGCFDSDWVESYSMEASKELVYGDTATLESSIDEAYKTTMARLIHLMADKFKLFEHLQALKRYLLLGQGDFIALLMESLSSNLDRPANSLYRHNLTAQLEHAIRGSNAQFESQDVLKRLDARMLELSHGEVGWDVFTLEYKVDPPVDVIVTPYAGRQYLKVFNFLWRIKRVEFALGTAWRRYMTGARGVLGAVQDKVGDDWKVSRCVIAEMIHFICQLQYYILFEVIESSWDKLQSRIRKPECTLDDIIEAHADYLEHITHKGLLGSVSLRKKTSSHHSFLDDTPVVTTFLSQLHEILKVMLAYKDATDGLYGYSVAEFTRRQELSARIETRTKDGKWGLTEHDTHMHDDSDNPSRSSTPFGTRGGRDSVQSNYQTPLVQMAAAGGDDSTLPSLRSTLKKLAGDFKAKVVMLLGDLAHQQDMDMRLLGVLVNFNGFYELPKRKKDRDRRGGDREKERSERPEKMERTERTEDRGEREERKKRERERDKDGRASSSTSGSRVTRAKAARTDRGERAAEE